LSFTNNRKESPPAPADEVLDTVGLYCPIPIIRTAERMKRLDGGAVLEVISDDRVILIDLPAWCRSTGNSFLGSRRDGDEFRLLVRKKEEHA
jgi:tRNA 2-thiouridine synthesizing protein A